MSRKIKSIMMILFKLFALISLPFASPVVIDCDFNWHTWTAVGALYYCKLKSNPSITSPGTRITGVNGDHDKNEKYKSSADVQGFYSWDSSQTINFIPHGLEQVFPSLCGISIRDGRIKEVHQSDLKAYTELRYLNLAFNDIIFIERDLFEYNLKLETINLQENKIKEIFPTVFDHLERLAWANVGNNSCIDKGLAENRFDVMTLIQDVREKCLIDSDESLMAFVAPALLFFIALPLLCYLIYLDVIFMRLLKEL